MRPYYLIYDFTRYKFKTKAYQEQRETRPVDVDYKTGLDVRLHPKHTLLHGELQKTEYFRDYDPVEKTHSHPILEVHFVYTRDAAGFAVSRTSTIYWYLSDSTIDTTGKTMVKYYSNLEAVAEGIRRRGNIVNDVALRVVGFVMAFDSIEQPAATLRAREFSMDYKTSIDAFVSVSVKDIITQLSEDTKYTFLDGMLSAELSVRNYMIGLVSISA